MNEQANTFDDEANAAMALREKLVDASTPGYQVEFDPLEAERAGAFVEDALSEVDAVESGLDLVEAEAGVVYSTDATSTVLRTGAGE